jgi:hypothetical protein
MKKIFLFLMALPLLGIGQNKNVVSATRLFPKVDKVLEFEKALANHSQKYHSGDYKWRVFEVQSGPDAGGYHITEGPFSWEGLDTRGNLGNEHNVDWNKSVAIHLTDRSTSSYSVYQESISSVQLTDYSDKINITHYFPKPGWGPQLRAEIAKFKKVWDASGESMAVYTSSSSGPAQFSVVQRYKQGLKERQADFRKPIKERYEAANGPDSWDSWVSATRTYVDHVWSELLFYRADLSSK